MSHGISAVIVIVIVVAVAIVLSITGPVELITEINVDDIKISDVDTAEEKIERDRILDMVTTQPKQFKLTLYSISQIPVNLRLFLVPPVYSAYIRFKSTGGVFIHI